MTDSRHDIVVFQERWNAFARHRGLHYRPLKVDGVKGKNTQIAIQKARYYLCVGSSAWRHNSTVITDELLRCLRDYKRRLPGETVRENLRRRRCASKRRQERAKRVREAKRPPAPVGGLSWIDGKRACTWLVQGVIATRAHGVPSYVTSGYRTPEYSESLCFHMCGAPSCPGRCAGRATNHAHVGYHQGAVDSTNAEAMRWKAQQLGYAFHNNLPADRVHTSYTGY